MKNISKAEHTAIKNLKERTDIVIKPADKGSAVVVMNTEDYLQEGHRQLSNSEFYKKLKSDPTNSIANENRLKIETDLDNFARRLI